MVYTLHFFSSKYSLYHKSDLFGSCIIHILYTGCAKIKKNNSGSKRLIPYRGIIAVCSQIHTKHINTLCGQNVELYIKTQSVPCSKHSVSVIKTGQLILYREIIAVCSEIHTKHINTAVWAERGIIYKDPVRTAQ